MKVGICSVGSELLSGDVADTNAAWLAQRVLESGCGVAAMMIVGDDRTRLLEAFDWLADRADVLVVGGGLGPTSDDLTRYAVAEFAGVDLERRPELVRHLHEVYDRLARTMPPDALRQADVPVGAWVHDPEGTAAGFSLEVVREGSPVAVHVLPGVPWEYQELAEREVLPDLVRRSGGVARITRTVHVAGLGESGVGAALRPVSDRLEAAHGDADDPEHGIEVGFLANAEEVLVRITATGPDPQAARDRADLVVDEAVALLGEAVTSVDERRLEDEVAQLLDELEATVATAEQCTAGRVAAALSSVPGSASYMRGGLVACTPAMLTELLDVSAEALAMSGPVNPTVVEAMARTAQRRCGADYAVAVTGVTEGPTSDGDPPVGTVMWAVAGPEGVATEERFIPAADRALIQVRAAAFALESLRRGLVSRRSPGHAPMHVTP